jgi:rhodanese-related sulfurtransferase
MPTTLPARHPVTEHPPAAPEDAVAHFRALLRLETDCSDVHAELGTGDPSFVLLDVRGPDTFAAGHVPGARNLPHGRISARNLAPFGEDAVFVVYCNGPHCNAADRAALRLARIGRAVKKMTGGLEGWRDEGFELATA